MTNIITIDERFARHQLEHGLVVAAAIPGPDLLVLTVPRAGRVSVIRVAWPNIRSVDISDGAFRVTDADSQATMTDLHSHLLTGSLNSAYLTREEVVAKVTTAKKVVQGGLLNESTDARVHIVGLNANFGLAERWSVKPATPPTEPAPGLPACRTVNLDALSAESTRVVLVLDGRTHGRGHLYLENAPYSSTTFAVGASAGTGCYFVTGPQRSGTTFLAHAISYDLGLPYIDEFDHYDPETFFNYQQFRELAVRSRNWVAQAPSLFHGLSDLRRDFPSVIPVVCRRDTNDIIASQRRVGWGEQEDSYERQQLGIAATDRRPISEIKYERWGRIKSDFGHYVEVSFDELEQHPLYATTRSEFEAKQWS
jgi:hypothetical protein